MPEICPRYARDMHKIRLRYAWDMPEICPRYAQDMPKICLKYAKDMPKIWPPVRQSWQNVCLTKRLSWSWQNVFLTKRLLTTINGQFKITWYLCENSYWWEPPGNQSICKKSNFRTEIGKFLNPAVIFCPHWSPIHQLIVTGGRRRPISTYFTPNIEQIFHLPNAMYDKNLHKLVSQCLFDVKVI